MDVRIWVAHALTGIVAGELEAVSGTFTQKFGGGTASDLTIPLGHLTTPDGVNIDWNAVARVVDWCLGGKYTLVLTAGTNVLGEWLMMKHPESISDQTLAVSGMEWDGYPALRSLHANYTYTNVDQLTIAKTLLEDAFIGWQTGFQITVPTVTSGVKRTAQWRTREGYYSDALDEIALPENGFDWRVTHTGTWTGGALTKVTRTIRFGSPTIRTSTPIVIRYDGPGAPIDNCLTFEQEWDFHRYAHSVYAWGAGDGAKKLFYEAGNNTLPNQGYVKITKNLSYPSITNPDALKALADADLQASQELRTPAQSELLIDRLPQIPALGDLMRVEIGPTWTIPHGYEGTMRIGEISFPVNANRVETVKVGAL
ncbi:hypothetical protein FYJ24_09340 [Actinomycetaceae bacterium WB03_NA08]|uniref:Minor tail protein n=1 Tax=Scrofimicrobium canadense TaxID=2652290 RepID=A0A6N7W956_9ACTO|nr:hypothetical protein [Scrofimicrobium canadense]MSS84962.1 hypothetical protein [Scrofimicrobium canadense]